MAQARVIITDPVTGKIEEDKLPLTYLQEVARDAFATAVRTTGPISVVPNDSGDTFTISSSATANSADSFLTNRQNHSGQQTASTISDLAAAVKGVIDGYVGAGTNVTVTKDLAAGKLVISSTGGGGTTTGTGIDAEAARDAIALALRATGGLTLTVDDPGDTITISSDFGPRLDAVEANLGAIGVEQVQNLSNLLDAKADDAELAAKMDKPPTGAYIIEAQFSSSPTDPRVSTDVTNTIVWWHTTYSTRPNNAVINDKQSMIVA